MSKNVTQLKDLPELFSGRPPGTTYEIIGYKDSSNVVRNLTVRTLGPNGYAELKQLSLQKLLGSSAVTLPGFPPEMVREAVDALVKAYSAPERVGPYTDPYVHPKGGGYATREGEAAVFLLRLLDLREGAQPADPGVVKVDLARAKAALIRELDLPAGKYIHVIKLADGRFVSVKVV